MLRTLTLSVVLCLGVLGVSAQVAPPASEDLNTAFKPMQWRSIGPFRGGRSVASVGVIGDPMTYYMGTTGGGLWKTGNMGITWENISDGFFKSGSVGATTPVTPTDERIEVRRPRAHGVPQGTVDVGREAQLDLVRLRIRDPHARRFLLSLGMGVVPVAS